MLQRAQEAVEKFHVTFGIDAEHNPTLSSSSVRKLRLALIQEELQELRNAYYDGRLDEVADAIGDLLYVVLGAAVSHGLDASKIFEEVHRSNMTKVGGHRDERGKWIKPDTYSPPSLNPARLKIDYSQSIDVLIREELAIIYNEITCGRASTWQARKMIERLLNGIDKGQLPLKEEEDGDEPTDSENSE